MLHPDQILLAGGGQLFSVLIFCPTLCYQLPLKNRRVEEEILANNGHLFVPETLCITTRFFQKYFKFKYRKRSIWSRRFYFHQTLFPATCIRERHIFSAQVVGEGVITNFYFLEFWSLLHRIHPYWKELSLSFIQNNDFLTKTQNKNGSSLRFIK